MTGDSAAQDDDADMAAPPTETSDVALLEDALQDALAAHAAGLLAAPFGVDAVALARARRRAEHADAQRRTERPDNP